MSNIPTYLKELVIERAGNFCEYCGLSQIGQEAAFHIDHITPIKANGETNEQNLALACVSCSLRKGARQFFTDRETQQEVPLFHPRRERWSDHFYWEDVRVIGRSATGRATIEALQMNRPTILDIRYEEVLRGRHPPSRLTSI